MLNVLRTMGQVVAWEILNPLLLHLKRNRRRVPMDAFRGINLGCGIDNPPHWLGLDGGLSVLLSAFPSWMITVLFWLFPGSNVAKRRDFFDRIRMTRILHHDFRYGLPFFDAAVDAVYSSHFFEHLEKKEALQLLKDSYRVLKPGGFIRICVPDLHGSVQEMKTALATYDAGDPSLVQKYVTKKRTGYTNHYSHHRYMYNYEDLKGLLESCGFVEVGRRTKGQGAIRDVECLDTREGLFVEAVKPFSP